jgi:hypothetical protein
MQFLKFEITAHISVGMVHSLSGSLGVCQSWCVYFSLIAHRLQYIGGVKISRGLQKECRVYLIKF